MDEFDNQVLPPTVELGRTLRKKFDDIFNGAEVQEYLQDWRESESDSIAKIDEEYFMLEFEDKPVFEATIGESDHIQLGWIFPSSKDDPCTRIELNLFKEGARYLLPGDHLPIDEEVDDSSDYSICCLPEYPPFIVLTHTVLLHSRGPDRSIDELALNYLKDLQEKGEKPRFLTDPECSELISAVNESGNENCVITN